MSSPTVTNPALTRDVLEDVLDSLERTPCLGGAHFDRCPGPDEPPAYRWTCHRCRALYRLRGVVAHPVPRDERDEAICQAYETDEQATCKTVAVAFGLSEGRVWRILRAGGVAMRRHQRTRAS